MWVLWWPRSVLNTWQNTYTSMITTKRITRGEENFDKLFKVRPPITHLQPKFRDILTFSWKEVCFTVNSSKQTVHMAAGCFQTQMRKAKGAVPLMGECIVGNTTLPFVLQSVLTQSSHLFDLLWRCPACRYCQGVVTKTNKPTNAQLMYHAHKWLQLAVQIHGSSRTLGCANALMGLYRIKLRSKKYYQRIFFHFVDTVVANSWLLFRNDCKDVGLQESKQLCLLEFKYFFSPALAMEGQVVCTQKESGYQFRMKKFSL